MKNKLFYLLVLVFAFSFSSINAQIKIGGNGGLNISNMTTNSSNSQWGSKIGVHLGGLLEYRLLNELGFQGGLLLSQKGAKADVVGGGSVKMSTTYIDIPLAAIYKYELSNFKIYGKGGVNVGMGLSGKYKQEGVGDGDDGTIDLDWGSSDTDTYKRIDFALLFGAGVELNDNIQIGWTYNLGLNDISADGQGEVKNKVFALTFTYFFAEL